MRTRLPRCHYIREPNMFVEEKLPTTSVKTVVLCDFEPICMEGLRSVLAGCDDLKLIGAETSLIAAMEIAAFHKPAAVVIDKAFGTHAVMDWVRRMRSTGTAALIWGVGLGEAEAMRLVQGGAMGVVRKTAEIAAILTAVRAVANGNSWIEDALMRDCERGVRSRRSSLTGREMQVLELVEQGLRNKDIGHTLGIQAGTVKIHLKHIFEKTGIRGRYGLALSGLKEKGLLSLPTM